MKTCRICEVEKPYTSFVKDKASSDGCVPYCRPCDNARKQTWIEENREKSNAWYREYRKAQRAANPEKAAKQDRKAYLKKMYGLTPEGYDDLVKAHDGKCAICGETEEGTMPIDHDHKTGKVRGILCHACNLGIGKFQDSPERLEQAAAYLRGYT